MRRYYLLICTLLLTGCGSLLKTEYERPALSVPQEWRVQETHETGSSFLQTREHWWDNFNDPLLSSLIAEMLVNNNDLASATIRLEQARVAAGLTNTNLTPDVTLGGNVSNTKNLKRDTNSRESYNSSFSLGYELDLWGKLALTREQAEWEVRASEQDRQATALSLIGTTAELYWTITNLNTQIRNQERSLSIARETLNLARGRHSAGAIRQLDVIQAEQSVLEREIQYRDLVQRREEMRNAMAILFNRPPTDRQSERQSLDIAQTVPIASSLPLEVISLRPDVQAAEWRLRSALAGSDVAKLGFYPTLSLSASLGAGSSIFQQWFSNPTRTLGSALSLPFIEWNTVQLTIEKSKLDVQQAAVDFRSKVYSALSDVDNAMSQRINYQQQKQNHLKNYQLSQKRFALARSQYSAGAVSIQTLLDAEDSLLNAQNSLTDTQYNYLNSTMKLWLALGGGAQNASDLTRN